MKKVFRILYNGIIFVLAVFLLAVAGTFLPIPGNYKLYTVQSGSMEPAVPMGSLIFVKSAEEYQIGEVITMKAGKTTVTHRLVEKELINGEQAYVTKGDANEEKDADPVSKSQIIGKKLLTVPYLGFPIAYARTKVGFILLVIIPATIIIYEELYKIKEEVVSKWKRSREKKERFSGLAVRGEQMKTGSDPQSEPPAREIEPTPFVRQSQAPPQPQFSRQKPRRKIV